jgi:broad specificity phosphatase PhoE
MPSSPDAIERTPVAVTTVLLVRHCLHDLGPSKLAGRLPGIALSDRGRAQAERLADRLEREGITELHSSPQQRTLETAAPIAERCGVKVEIVQALDEVNFGEWAGQSFQELEADPRWVAWNSEREYASTPTGEKISDLAKRVIRHIEHCCEAGALARIAMVTHAEVIRTAVLHCLGMPFSAFGRIEVAPASISKIVFANDGPVLTGLNEMVVV